ARRLPREVDVLELDVNRPDDVRAVNDELAGRWGTVDGVLHAIAFAPANALSAGPIRTMAAKGIPGFSLLADAWSKRAPLGWDVGDPTVVARVALWLFSDWSRGVCGELIHVDGGFHAMGTDLLSKEDQARL